MQNKTLLIIRKNRLIVSRLFGILILALLLFTGHSFSYDGITDLILEISGLFLISICSFGRLWSHLYIAGFKSGTLITEGPYSMTRNPLYFFSLLGALGTGLASENILVLVLIIIFYVSYYPFTIISEENNLQEKFGQAFSDYKNRVPRFLPKFSLYRTPDSYNISVGNLVHNLLEALAILWIFIVLRLIEYFHQLNALPTLWKFP